MWVTVPHDPRSVNKDAPNRHLHSAPPSPRSTPARPTRPAPPLLPALLFPPLTFSDCDVLGLVCTHKSTVTHVAVDSWSGGLSAIPIRP